MRENMMIYIIQNSIIFFLKYSIFIEILPNFGEFQNEKPMQQMKNVVCLKDKSKNNLPVLENIEKVGLRVPNGPYVQYKLIFRKTVPPTFCRYPGSTPVSNEDDPTKIRKKCHSECFGYGVPSEKKCYYEPLYLW